MAECFTQLESNNLSKVAEAKEKLYEQFRTLNEPWLLNGLYDYYLQTNSSRIIEVLVNVREPHWNFLFDRINDSMVNKNTNIHIKVQALTLLGHIIRRHPTWLYHIVDHQLFKSLLKLLKVETEILPLISALLALVVLLPIIPFQMGQHLSDLFDIFSRLAAWNCTNTGKIIEEQMVHMQIALYSLFQRLYGMYPCHFISHLRNYYRKGDVSPIFKHTIKPMLVTVKMHPELVTTTMDYETTAEKWKMMLPHEIIVQCEKFSLELTDRCSNESCFFTSSFRSRSGTTNSALQGEASSLHALKNTARYYGNEKEFFSPSMVLSPSNQITESAPANIHIQGQRLISGISLQSQEGTSPPEAAIEATPETTPLRDIRYSPRIPLASSKVAKALNNFTTKNCASPSCGNTPTHSQPSSPLRKDSSPFVFPSDPRATAFRKDSYTQQKVQRVMLERQQSDTDKSRTIPTSAAPPPPSPLKFITTYEGGAVIHPIATHRIESPVSQEDEEVGLIVKQGEFDRNINFRQCDSVLQDVEETGTEVQIYEDLEHGSPCAKGGLHMPNSKSMNEFAKRVHRLRYHSQCAPEFEKSDDSYGAEKNPSSTKSTVRRASSWPQLKTFPCKTSKETSNNKLDVTKEESADQQVESQTTKDNVTSSYTQTDHFWPYEHLFLGIFPSLEYNNDYKSPAPSPAPYNTALERCASLSSYETVDKYIEVAVQASGTLDTVKSLKEQLQLKHLQFLFEKHRRETHALKNRRLLADARDMKVLQEHNSALRDQVQLQQKEIDNLKQELENLKSQAYNKERDIQEKLCFAENQCKIAQREFREATERNVNISLQLKAVEEKYRDLTKSWQDAQALLVDATSEVQIAKEKAWAGDRGREALEVANREILFLGELIIKYQKRLVDLPSLKRSDCEFIKLAEAYKHEVNNLNYQLDTKANLAEAYRTRITELEHAIAQSDEMLTAQKKLFNDTKDECHEKLEAVESKYRTQLKINRALESKMFDLFQQIEAKRNLQSPDTSSCHEVQPSITERSATAGLSPHSSPLSCSLASSEGSIAFLNNDVKEMRNLQVIADPNDPLNQKVVVREEADPALLRQYVLAAAAAASSASTSSAATTSKHD